MKAMRHVYMNKLCVGHIFDEEQHRGDNKAGGDSYNIL